MASSSFKDTSFLIITLLLVNIIIVNGVIVRISYLYKAEPGIYISHNWVWGTAIMVLICTTVLYAFAGYALITSKKPFKYALACAAVVHIVSLTAITTIIKDLVTLIGLLSSIAIINTIFALLHRASSNNYS